MFRNLLIACMIVVIAIGLTMASKSFLKTQKGDFFSLEKGEIVPDFFFRDMNGQSYSLHDLNEKPVIIHFWATWCPPCVVEFPTLIKMAKANPNVTILAFSTDRKPETITRFLSEKMPSLPHNFIVVHDQDRAITQDKFNVFQLPESFVLDNKGRIQSHIKGAYLDWQTMAVPSH